MIIQKRNNTHGFYKRAESVYIKRNTRSTPIKRIADIEHGELYKTKQGYCKIMKYIDYRNVLVEFIDTGYQYWSTMANLFKGKGRDYRYKSVYSVGYLGDGFRNIKSQYHAKFVIKLRKIWTSMIHRCYVKTSSVYHLYGGAGVKIDPRWHNFSTFFMDYMKLDGYDYKLACDNLLELDKDKLQQDIPKNKRMYSKATCCLLSHADNVKYMDNGKWFIAIKPFDDSNDNAHQQRVSIEYNISHFAELNGLSFKSVSACVLGTKNARSCKGYRFLPYADDINISDIEDALSNGLSWNDILENYTNIEVIGDNYKDAVIGVPFVAVHPIINGHIQITIERNMTKFCKKYSLCTYNAQSCLGGMYTRYTHKGYKFLYYYDDIDMVELTNDVNCGIPWKDMRIKYPKRI